MYQRLLLIILFIATLSASSTRGEAPQANKHFVLVLGLDGVSYQLMTKMYDGGYFREFQRAIPMVASFPSISDPNWDHLMNTPIEAGYTKAHYEFTKNADGTIGSAVGNLINHLTNPPQYEKAFDFKAEGIFQHLMSMTWSETSALFWTESLERVLLDPKNIKGDLYKAFIINTDFISHTQGEKSLMDYLKKLNDRLQKTRKAFEKQYDKTLEIILVSDHGNYYHKPTSIKFEKIIGKNFHLKDHIKNDNDYAFVPSEIISFGAFYCLDKTKSKLAKAFTKVPHVHVSLYDEGSNKIHVFSAVGESRITIDPKNKMLSYELLNGADPFNQIDLFKKHKKLSFEKYFFKTLNKKYPNALVRAWEGFYKNARVPASVLVSPELGYVFSSEALELLTALSGVHSSHGSFAKEESFGMVMSTLPLQAEAITPFEFQDLIYKVQTAKR